MNKLAIPLSFLCVIAIWSTTPLAIQWSSGNAPLSSALLRMVLGCGFCSLLLFSRGLALQFNAATRPLYLVGGLSIFLGMSLIYWASQSIPSGWVAVLFGLSPLFTGIFSSFVEPESKLSLNRIIGIILGLFGLFFVFQAGLSVNQNTLQGVILIVISVLISSSSSVWMRQLSTKTDISGMQITTGSLLIAIPCFLVSAVVVDPIDNIQYSNKALLSIAYLGIVGTGIGFSLYYFLLKQISASKLALVTLVTPITALLIGNWFNDEAIVADIWIGGICVCLGLLLYQYKPRLGWRKL